MFARIFGVSDKTFQFLFSSKSSFLKKLSIILPITFWGSIFYQLQPIFYKFGIDVITSGKTSFTLPFWQKEISFDSPLHFLGGILLVLFTLNMLDSLLNYFKDNLLQKLNYDISAGFEDRFTEFLSRFDGSFIGAENNMRLVEDIQYRLRSVENQISGLISQMIAIPTSIITILFILPLIHPYLVAFVLFYSLVNMIFEHITWRQWQKYEMVRSRLGGLAGRIRSWIIYYFPRVISNGWVGKLWELYQEKRQKEFELNYEQDLLDRRLKLLKNFCLNVLDLLSKVLAGFLVLGGQITIGTFVVFEQYIGRFRSIFDDLGALIKNFVEIRFELFKIDFLLNLQPKLDYSNILPFADKQIKTIEIENLSFSYPAFYEEEKEYFEKMKQKLKIASGEPKEKAQTWWQKFSQNFQKSSKNSWEQRNYQKTLTELDKMLEKSGESKEILKNLNLRLEIGKTYALVGYNGAGKTTLSSLIKRNLDPTIGDILVNGKNLKTVEPKEWKSLISSMEQNSVIWPGISVRDNLLLGSERVISEQKMLEALKQVGLEKEIQDLDLICGESLELSGGQEQLLELARVMIQKKPLLILDEGTNQLDAMKEANIINILNQIKKEAIIIFISHRMTSASKCDQIVVLDQGRIQAFGKHKELVESESGNLYQEMWKLQVENASEDLVTAEKN